MRRRIRRRHSEDGTQEPRYVPWFARVPAGVYWTLVAVITLVLIFGWDRAAQQNAREHIANAEELKNKGSYEEAIERYKRAFQNPRLSRRAKADVAVQIAHTYFEHMQNYNLANSYYVRARQLSPKIVERPLVEERLRVSRQRMTSDEHAESGSKANIPAGRGIVSPPTADREGPVIATVGTREIHAGEISRMLRENGIDPAQEFEQDPKRLEARVRDYLEREVLYEAGMSAGLQRDSGTLQRVFDYQRSLIAERALNEQVTKTRTVSEEDVRKYYDENQRLFSRPARIGVAMIRTPDEARAREAQAALHAGASFADAVTSFSVDAESTRTGGSVGYINEGDQVIPGVGSAPDVVNALFQMKSGDISRITRIGDAFYIFRIASKAPGHKESLDEARPGIIARLRGGNIEQQKERAREELRGKFPPIIREQGLAALVAFTTKSAGEGTTSTTADIDSTEALRK